MSAKQYVNLCPNSPPVIIEGGEKNKKMGAHDWLSLRVRANEYGSLALLPRGNSEGVDDRSNRPRQRNSASRHSASMDRNCLTKRCAFLSRGVMKPAASQAFEDARSTSSALTGGPSRGKLVKLTVCVDLGRSVSACQKAFEHLITNPTTAFPFAIRPPVNADPKVTPKQRKRQYPSGEGPMAVDRIIQPRISDFSAVNEPFNPQSTPITPGPGEPPKKKRGRPSKAEYEIRLAEYAARGEPLPPPRKPKTPKRSAERPAPTANMFTPTTGAAVEGGSLLTPTQPEAGAAGSTPAPGVPSRPGTADKGTRNLALEATALAAEQIQPSSGNDSEPRAGRKGSGVQSESLEMAHEFGPHEALLAQMQEHAASVEHQTPDHDTSSRGPPASDQRAWEAYQPPTST